MIIVKVTYTVKLEFVKENQNNIDVFMADFKRLKQNNFRYNVYLQPDGITFIHFSHYENENIQQQLLKVPSFILFQQKRDASGLAVIPEINVLKTVACSHQIIDF
ncbi:hypothetical protein AAKU52_002764 [Pedobacter sp. CG_S7]|uniref:hypothetical protein n=1 Tax=Pedobacter sp. CG_S7 TaxID=3143930 RepID=UPI00339969E5